MEAGWILVATAAAKLSERFSLRQHVQTDKHIQILILTLILMYVWMDLAREVVFSK